MLHTDYDKVFTSGKFSICRGDYTNLPASMIAEEFSDKQMQELVDEIDAEMRDMYSERELNLLADYHAGKELSQQDYIFADDMSAKEFCITERTAVRMGMRYWEDLSDDEFDTLSDMIVCSGIKPLYDVGMTIKYFDTETGILHELKIWKVEIENEILYCNEYDGERICSEWEIPIESYIYQLTSGMLN